MRCEHVCRRRYCDNTVRNIPQTLTAVNFLFTTLFFPTLSAGCQAISHMGQARLWNFHVTQCAVHIYRYVYECVGVYVLLVRPRTPIYTNLCL